MRLTTLRRDEDVKALVARVYRGASARVRDRAEKALLEANPGIAEGRIRPGAVLVIPDVEGTATLGEQESGPEAVGSLLRAAAEEFGNLRGALAPLPGQQEEEAKITLSRASTPELRRTAERQPELRRNLDAITAAANADIKQAAVLRTTQEQGFAEIEKDLDELLTLFGEQFRR